MMQRKHPNNETNIYRCTNICLTWESYLRPEVTYATTLPLRCNEIVLVPVTSTALYLATSAVYPWTLSHPSVCNTF